MGLLYVLLFAVFVFLKEILFDGLRSFVANSGGWGTEKTAATSCYIIYTNIIKGI